MKKKYAYEKDPTMDALVGGLWALLVFAIVGLGMVFHKSKKDAEHRIPCTKEKYHVE